jgi:hypothetical protein
MRAPVQLAIELSRAHKKRFSGKGITENVSSRGLRVITRSMWQPEARVRVSFAGEDIDEQARVVYCQRMPKRKFAVGIQFSARE